MIDHAMVEAGRVADLIGAMEIRIATLKDGDQLLEQTEARLGRLEQVAAETTAQLERREQLRDELGRELRRLETELQSVTESARRQVAELVNQKKEFDAFDRRPSTRGIPSRSFATNWERRLKRRTSNAWYGPERAVGFAPPAVDPRDDEAPNAENNQRDQTLRCRSRAGLARSGELHRDASRWEDSPA